MNEFDHRPDRQLGDLLREALATPDDAGFVSRVMAAAPWAAPRESGWDVLGRWARPGVAAAALLLLLAGGWFRQAGGPRESGEELALAVPAVDAGGLLEGNEVPQLDVDLVLMGEQ